MTSTRSRLAATLTLACLTFAWSASTPAQDPAAPKDEGLEKLLEKIDDKAKPEPDKAKPAGESKDEGLDRLLDKLDAKAKPDGDQPKPSALAPKDEGLDKLLEGLGQSKDEPAPDDKKPGPPGGNPDDQPKPGEAKPDPLGGDEKNLDNRLEELIGRKPKKKDGDKRDGQGGGPLGDIIKEMREVEERLGKPDTGTETRKKQTEIVKSLDQLIEQMKNSTSQSQAMKMMREGGKKPGPPQPGQQQGQLPGAAANGVGMAKAEKPKTPPGLIDNAKALWGQLPSQFRDDVDNVLNESPLPIKADLIRLYYLSLGKKNSTKGE